MLTHRKDLNTKIIVITPIKDEEWILPSFLWACSRFADHILILDQQSSDRSREICEEFPKVTVIDNPSAVYNEADRSHLLVSNARRLFGEGNLLVALDSDEILTFSSLNIKRWDQLRSLPLGTQIYFEKSEIFSNPWNCVRANCSFAYAYVDDGAEMQGLLIHSRRLPGDDKCKTYITSQIILMHFAHVRWTEWCARQAIYCMIENVNQSKSHRNRSCYYAPRFFLRFGAKNRVPIPSDWLEGYSSAGIDILSHTTNKYNAFHLRGLKMFSQHGISRFRFDPIWWINWEDARLYFQQQAIADLPTFPLIRPNVFIRSVQTVSELLYFSLKILFGFIRTFISGLIKRP